MEYVVLKIKGKQYLVSEGDILFVDKLFEPDKVDVLLKVTKDSVQIGKPTLEKGRLKIKIIASEKGKKIQVMKYKAKSRYRKKIGFRPSLTKLQIENI